MMEEVRDEELSLQHPSLALLLFDGQKYRASYYCYVFNARWQK